MIKLVNNRKHVFSRVITIIFCWFSLNGLAASGPNKKVDLNKDAETIKQIMYQQQRAWNDGDLEAFMQAYWKSDQLKFVGKNGIKHGWQTTLDNYRKTYPDRQTMGQLRFDIITVEAKDDRAFVLGKWALKREKDNPSGYYTLYWKKMNGQWKIVIDHTN